MHFTSMMFIFADEAVYSFVYFNYTNKKNHEFWFWYSVNERLVFRDNELDPLVELDSILGQNLEQVYWR